jgi:serine/threonine protein kinase/WD40 repeat protein
VQERDLIVGVLAAQAGFVTPAEVLTAAASGLIEAGSASLLTQLERNGVLSSERRKTLEALADQALAARNGDAHAVLTSLGAAPELIETLVSAVAVEGNGAGGQPAAAPAVPLERPGQYTRLRELGRGAQSVVRAARDEIVGREVALKELVTQSSTPGDASSRAARARFLREVRLVAGLDHPGIVSVHEVARREDGTLFCAQKLIRGETLQARLAKSSALGGRLELLRHVIDACQAVGFAHSKHVIHRDLKPSNIMVGEYGETVVVDWGLAKHREEAEEVVPLVPSSPEPGLTVAGAALGTPAYMSPEQARGDLAAIDARSDVFSLGAILYHLLTGRPPFVGATAEHILENVRSGRLHPVRMLEPSAPPEVAAIAERALRPQPSDRYPDAEELARELSAYVSGGRVGAYQYGPWELLRKFASSHRALLTGVAIAAAALLLAALVVAVRLHLTRMDLASSFLERAYRAEQDGDWSKAAAYFAAARVQHDTPEERWGLATAGARLTERTVSLHGPPGTITDVGVLPDGRTFSVRRAPDHIEVRAVDDGKVLWSLPAEPALGFTVLPAGVIRFTRPESFDFYDGAAGRKLLQWPRSSGFPCPGAFPPVATELNGQLLRQEAGGAMRVIATGTAPGVFCAASPDGKRAAYVDASLAIHLVSLEDGHELARREFDFQQEFRFSPHGLVVFKQGRLDVIGGPEGDFTIDLPESRFGPGIFGDNSEGYALSPDGDLVAIASNRGATETTVVDLRSRSIRGIFHHTSGRPQLTFSLDGNQVFAAGMNNGSALSGWRLPAEDLPKLPRWWNLGALSRSGSTALLLNSSSGRYELSRPVGTVIASGVQSLGWNAHIVGDGPGVAFIAKDPDVVVLRNLEKDRVIWQHPCGHCTDFSVSDDGSRFVQVGLDDGLEVWDTRSDRRLFQDKRRVKVQTRVTISGDGRLLAWNVLDALIVRSLSTGQEHTVSLDSGVRGLGFSPDSGQLVTVTSSRVTLRETASGRVLWNVPQDASQTVDINWSPDRRSLILKHGWIATEVLDAATGERLARFPGLSRAVTPVLAELYSPDLRVKAVTTMTTWEIRPVPPPDETPPAESLARTLRKTGLEFRGVDLVAAP